MVKDISVIVEEVKEKQTGDDKAFLQFLQTLDIDTLNQLYFIFNGGGSLRNPRQMLTLFIIPLSFFCGLIIVFMHSSSQETGLFNPDDREFIKVLFGFAIALIGIFKYIKILRLTKETELINLSNRIVIKQKTLSMITFVLEEKYKTLSSSS